MSKSGKKSSVLISGSSTGIGEAAAKLLSEKGWTVFAGVRKQADAEKLKSYSSNIHPVILDVTKEDQIKEAVEQVRVAVGEDGLDALVNNAGLLYSGPTEFISIEDVQKQFDVNVFGFVRLTQAAMPLIRIGKPGRVINISSIGAEQFAPYVGVYDGTKAAMEVITQSFRQEVAKWGIRVIIIRPGPVETAFESTLMTIYKEYMKRFAPGSMCYKLYGKDLEHLPKAAEPFKKNMIDPKRVAERIYQAATAKNPKLMYYDTWGSFFTIQMIRWMPMSVYDSFIGRIFFAKE